MGKCKHCGSETTNKEVDGTIYDWCTNRFCGLPINGIIEVKQKNTAESHMKLARFMFFDPTANTYSSTVTQGQEYDVIMIDTLDNEVSDITSADDAYDNSGMDYEFIMSGLQSNDQAVVSWFKSVFKTDIGVAVQSFREQGFKIFENLNS